MMVVGLMLLVLFIVSVVCLFPRRTRRAAKWSAPILFVAFITVAIIDGGRLNEDARALGFKDHSDYREATEAGVKDAAVWAIMRDQKEAIRAEQLKAEAAEAEKKRLAEAAEKERASRDAAAEQERLRTAEAEQKAREAAAAKAAEEAKAAECRSDLRCWSEKYVARATVYCRDVVERMAKNNFEWIDGMLEPKFSHYRWANKSKGIVTFAGDRIKYQNGFGAWIIHVYECDFDPASERVVDVRARPGRL